MEQDHYTTALCLSGLVRAGVGSDKAYNLYKLAQSSNRSLVVRFVLTMDSHRLGLASMGLCYGNQIDRYEIRWCSFAALLCVHV
jgi:hypothetical protein